MSSLHLRSILRLVFAGLVFASPIFIFIMIQMGGVTFPFWDNWEAVPFLVQYYDEGIWPTLKQIVTLPNQHCRPVTLRLVQLFNGVLTHWDIRSEYIYLYLALFGTFLVHCGIVRRLDGAKKGLSLPAWCLLSLVSILYFSPANHNNHWWSWMLQLNLYNFFSLAALALICFEPRSWRANWLALLFCWLSVYTLTNGLFLVLVVAGISQLASARPRRFSRMTFFWLVNIVAIYVTYFPVPEPGMAARPSLLKVLVFVLAYLGTPIATLVNFPYRNLFEPPLHIEFSAIVGAFLLMGFAHLLYRLRKELLAPRAPLLLMLGFAAFVLLSAGGTGWGRVTFDHYGVRNGGSSRYVMTSSYFLFGMLYFLFDRWKKRIGVELERSRPSRILRLGLGVFLVFMCLSVRTYARSVNLYLQARTHNALISRGFHPDGRNTDVDMFLYPNKERLIYMRNQLVRLRLGPYAYPRGAVSLLR